MSLTYKERIILYTIKKEHKSQFGMTRQHMFCPFSFCHCVVCPSIYDIVSERRISRNSRDDMTFDNGPFYFLFFFADHPQNKKRKKKKEP
jgi:hypothetical protein